MPGADGPPVGPGKRTESRFVSPQFALLRLLCVFSGSSRKGGAFRHQREPGWCCLRPPQETWTFKIYPSLRMCCSTRPSSPLSFLGSQWSPGASWLSWSSWPQGELSIADSNVCRYSWICIICTVVVLSEDSAGSCNFYRF